MHNGVCLCAYHHTLVHEGGYTIEHIEADSSQLNEQFIQQQHDDVSLFDFEKSLRNDRDSFNTVRKLSPTRFRYQIRDSSGQTISGRSSNDVKCAEQTVPTHAEQTDNTTINCRSTTTADTKEYTRVYSGDRCSEAIPGTYYGKKTHGHTKGHIKGYTPAFTYETPSSYGMTALDHSA